ncbi:hypothetical protein C8Q78DRAFT_992933 [Trametes maxima]|nr:hypothetical protein C8Q78DRAFT_992933 [Trametes maxima]
MSCPRRVEPEDTTRLSAFWKLRRRGTVAGKWRRLPTRLEPRPLKSPFGALSIGHGRHGGVSKRPRVAGIALNMLLGGFAWPSKLVNEVRRAGDEDGGETDWRTTFRLSEPGASRYLGEHYGILLVMLQIRIRHDDEPRQASLVDYPVAMLDEPCTNRSSACEWRTTKNYTRENTHTVLDEPRTSIVSGRGGERVEREDGGEDVGKKSPGKSPELIADSAVALTIFTGFQPPAASLYSLHIPAASLVRTCPHFLVFPPPFEAQPQCSILHTLLLSRCPEHRHHSKPTLGAWLIQLSALCIQPKSVVHPALATTPVASATTFLLA